MQAPCKIAISTESYQDAVGAGESNSPDRSHGLPGGASARTPDVKASGVRSALVYFGRDLIEDSSSRLTIGGCDFRDGELNSPVNTVHERKSLGLVGKRAFDIVFAVSMLTVFAPLLLVLYLVVKFTSNGPGIFRQLRVGKGGELFPCLKFRTMVPDAQERLSKLLESDPDARAEWEETQKLRNDPRITSIGNFLRRTSLDELPQLWNILVGEMSVVGPRPIIEDEVKRYGRSFDYYCAGRPGLTGPWQVSGRNDISYGERVKLDENYVLNRTFIGDFVICLKTVRAVLASQGSY